MGLPTEDKARKALPYWTFFTEYFLKAWMAVANVAIKGNEQHNPGQPLHWAREKSTDQLNTAFRHQIDYGMGVKKDTDGQWHLAKAIWRLSAQLQLDIEAEEKEAVIDALPMTPGIVTRVDDLPTADDRKRKFKTGDKVVVTGHMPGMVEAFKGRTGIVEYFPACGHRAFYVRFDDGALGYLYGGELTLAEDCG